MNAKCRYWIQTSQEHTGLCSLVKWVKKALTWYMEGGHFKYTLEGRTYLTTLPEWTQAATVEGLGGAEVEPGLSQPWCAPALPAEGTPQQTGASLRQLGHMVCWNPLISTGPQVQTPACVLSSGSVLFSSFLVVQSYLLLLIIISTMHSVF